MDLTFWCLILWALTSGRAFVLPSPENVTVNCDNFETLVYWNYSENLVDTLFQVHLRGDIRNSTNVTFKTREHYANITGRLDDTGYIKYTIKIRATNLTHTSSFSPPVRFAFDKIVEDDAIVMCKLDFPPVTMKYTFGHLSLSFQNPLHLYENTPALKYLRSNTYPNLKNSQLCYQVIDQSNITKEFYCHYQNPTCEENLHISDKKEQYCIKLSGNIAARANVRAAKFCSPLNQRGSPPPSVIVTLVSLLLIAGAVVVLGAVMFHKKIVKPNQTFPFPWPDLSKNGAWNMDPVDSDMDDLSVVFSPSETSEDPLLLEHTSNGCHRSADCSRFPIGPDHVPQEEQDWENQENEELERVTESTDWETGGPPSSDYDSRQVMPVGVRLGEEHGEEEEEEETHSKGLAEWSNEVSEHLVNQELGNSSGCSSTYGYESRNFNDEDEKLGASRNMEDEEQSEQSSEEEERYEKEQQINQELGNPLTDYEPRHISVEMSPGDFADGYGA